MFDFFEKYTKDNPDLLWFIGIFVVLFFIWILSGGPQRSADERNNQFIRPLAPVDSGETYHRDIMPPSWKETLLK